MDEIQSLREVDSRSPAVTRAVAVLEQLGGAREPVGLSELSRRLDLAKSTIANLCTALEATDMVRRVGDGWLLGYKVHELGESFRRSTDLVAEFSRLAGTMPAASEETVLLAVLDGTEVVHLARHEGTQPIRLSSDIGLRMPAVVTAMGKAMLAQLAWDELEQRLRRMSSLPRPTPRSHRTVECLRSDLAATGLRGYGLDGGEAVDGVTCVGVAIPGRGSIPLAVGVTLLSSRATPRHLDSLAADLHVLARQLSRLSGL